MPNFCIFFGCSSRSSRDPVSFYSVPAVLHFKHKPELNALSLRRREQWIAAIQRNDLTERKLKNEKVCSKHFLTGKPAALKDVDNPDWIPSQYEEHSTCVTKKRPTAARRNRISKQKQKNDEMVVTSSDEKAEQMVQEEGNAEKPSNVSTSPRVDSPTSTTVP